MDDAELQAIRARRMAEMRSTQGTGPSASAGLPAGFNPAAPGGQGNGEDQAEKKRQMDEARRGMLFQILENDARERLARIKIVKEEKARAVEDMLLRMAQGGQLRSKVSEQQLIDMLEQISESTKQETKITYNRRRFADSDDDDDFDL
ncbi:Programmed cell death protein 5 [Rhizophlyctis rosea]|uniref:Programmed cell death protein 5 n=1 Tax=Rhizophlyctis rosea TaxID=64517 RepID=A0AAD5X0Z9_9FUNG|nr:Programmed cell death protein 5 [Rhizophlyctis rosea]